jgi:hypothetical protein
MDLVHVTLENEKVVCKAPDSIFTSSRAYQIFLDVHATRTFGYGKYTIKRDPSQYCLAPFYAVGNDGECLVIK